mmetsp:Transcript_55057/g.159898  ORF Transcript_55057/g.159898 Transcript_55057/m.159898 type:complete len:372 (-) Transcript_55057:766-1881(-)
MLPLSSRATNRHHSALCCSKRKALSCSAQSCPPSPMWSATSCNVRVACSKTIGLGDRANFMTHGASLVSASTASRTSSKISKHWKVKRHCVTMSSSSHFSFNVCSSKFGSREFATYCADSRICAKLPMSITHSRTMSSSEKPGTKSFVSRSSSPASQSSPQGMSSRLTFARVPRISTSRSGLSMQLCAVKTNECIQLDIRTVWLCSISCSCCMAIGCEHTCRTTLHSNESRVFSTLTMTCGKRPLCTMTSAANGCVARFAISATRSFPTRCSGKCTTSCNNMTMPSRWKAIVDLQRSSIENWYRSFSTLPRIGGFRNKSTSTFTMPDSISEPRIPSSKERLYKSVSDDRASRKSSWLARSISLDNVSCDFI